MKTLIQIEADAIFKTRDGLTIPAQCLDVRESATPPARIIRMGRGFVARAYDLDMTEPLKPMPTYVEE